MKLSPTLKGSIGVVLVTVALAIIFVPMVFDSQQKLPAEWAEEVSMPPLSTNELDFAKLAPDDENSDSQVVVS